jgi:hypothetical protein
MSRSTSAPLRIGLLLDSREKIPALFAAIVQDIQASNFASIELLVVRKAARGGLRRTNHQAYVLPVSCDGYWTRN